jgi:hypothetical protein
MAVLVSITLSDGSSLSFTPASQRDFRGFVSEGPFITSLELLAPGLGRFNTIDNLIVGSAVPEPASMLLASIASVGCMSLRRRVRSLRA